MKKLTFLCLLTLLSTFTFSAFADDAPKPKPPSTCTLPLPPVPLDPTSSGCNGGWLEDAF